MRKKMLIAVFSVIVILVVAISPVGAITHGQPDGNNHPYVGVALGPAKGDNPKDTLKDKSLPPDKPIKDPLPDNPDDDKKVDDQKDDDKKVDVKKVDVKKVDVKKVDHQKVDDQKDDDQKVDDRKVDDRKVDDRKVDDKKVDDKLLHYVIA
jgi:hypothetical protein